MIKQEIDKIKDWLEQKAESKRQKAIHKLMAPGFSSPTDNFDELPNDDMEIIEEDELQKLKEMKEIKRDYRDLFKELKEIKSAIAYTNTAIDNAKQKLVFEFEAWFEDTFEDPLVIAN